MKTALSFAIFAMCFTAQYVPPNFGYYGNRPFFRGDVYSTQNDTVHYWTFPQQEKQAEQSQNGLENNWNWNWNQGSGPAQYNYVSQPPVPPQRVIFQPAPLKVQVPKLEKYIMLPVRDQTNKDYYKDWNYLRDGTRTLDIQNRYAVDKHIPYQNDLTQFKDVTATGSNTWKHKNDWYV